MDGPAAQSCWLRTEDEEVEAVGIDGFFPQRGWTVRKKILEGSGQRLKRSVLKYGSKEPK